MGEKDDGRGAAALLEDDQFWEDFRAEIAKPIDQHTARTLRDAGNVNAKIGLAFDMNDYDRVIADFTPSYTSILLDKLTATTRDYVRNVLADWQVGDLPGGRGLPDVIAALQPIFGKARARTIAATEVTRLFDQGSRISHNLAGITMEEWQTSQDDRVCDICGPLDGQRFGTNEGPRPVDDTHVNCRCARLPVGDGIDFGRYTDPKGR